MLESVDEKILLTVILGNIEAVKNGAITIEEAEKFIFSPHMKKKLMAKKCNKKIVELVMKGCEFEDINDLIPEKLEEVMEETKQEVLKLLKNYKEINNTFWLEEQNVPQRKVKGKEQKIIDICEAQRLKKALSIVIHAEAINMPEIVLTRDIVSYFGDMKAEISFDIYTY